MEGTPIILTTGTFNIVHAGHIELFEYCKKLEGKLIVGINSDPYLIKKYGSKYITLEKRLKVLKQIKLIDEIIVFEEETPIKLILNLKPNIYVKGPDYNKELLIEKDALEKVKAKILIAGDKKIMSTSYIIF
jgi:rfaE bifunctional protein nucleotidyltransferase chain/domain